MSHKENTMRALKDLPLFIDRWQCRIGWHRWTKWSDAVESPGGQFILQDRRCVDCNYYDKMTRMK